MINKVSGTSVRQKRHSRLRKRLMGTTERPRLAVFRSLRHVYAQIIDDLKGSTITAASTLDKEIGETKGVSMKELAKKVGELVAQRAKEKGVTSVVFDRAGYKYHGRVAAVADGARAQGLAL